MYPAGPLQILRYLLQQIAEPFKPRLLEWETNHLRVFECLHPQLSSFCRADALYNNTNNNVAGHHLQRPEERLAREPLIPSTIGRNNNRRADPMYCFNELPCATRMAKLVKAVVKQHEATSLPLRLVELGIVFVLQHMLGQGEVAIAKGRQRL